jgi:hypothetical protein
LAGAHNRDVKGDRVEAVVDTGQGTQTFEIVARRAGRRIEITTVRGVVEVTEVTRAGTPIRTGRFMANRLIALVEHPAVEGNGGGVEVETRRRMGADQPSRSSRTRRPDLTGDGPRQLTVLGDDEGSDGGDEGGA